MKWIGTAAAAAALTLAGVASAQSNVTLYGKFDIGGRKAIGSDFTEMATGSDSRLGFRGTEDLGGGLKVFFQLEHRFFPDTGAVDGAQFWKGISNVGLEGAWGRVGFGRQYVAAFSLAQNQLDPFGGDTVAQVRDVALRVGGITRVRIDGSIRYDVRLGAFNFAASIAEDNKNGGPDEPYSVAGNYRAGPLLVAAGYENPAGEGDEQWNIGAGYQFGPAWVTTGYASGTTNAGVKARGWMAGVNWKLGTGDVKAAYGEQRRDGERMVQKLGLGYHHSLSKRTTIYADVGHDAEATSNKTGYDLGIIHTF
jgi:predicted porin